jgi:glycosyltransferase involved in cell wall biosynthesis
MILLLKSWLRQAYPERYGHIRDIHHRLRHFFEGSTISCVGGIVRLVWRVITFPFRVTLAFYHVAPFLPEILNRAPVNIAPQPAGAPRKIVMLVISEVWRDPRVERHARALAAAGFEVEVLFPDYFSHTAPNGWGHWGPCVTFTALPGLYYRFTFGFPYLFGRKFLRAAQQKRPFAFHSHDLNTAFIALAAARTAECHCVCDFHEWYSENVSWDPVTQSYRPHHFLKKAIYAWAERIVLRNATAVITVCSSIADELHAVCGSARSVLVSRNVPSLGGLVRPATGESLRQSLKLSENRFVVLYSGGTGPTRFLEPIVKAMAMTPRATLVIRGPDIESYGASYLRLARRLGIESRVFCLPPVPPSDVVNAAAAASAGIWTLPNLCKNFYYALPNKVFEYLAAGLPVLVADYPEVRRILGAYDVGLSFDPYDPASIAAQINRLADSPELCQRFRDNAAVAWQELGRLDESGKVVKLYQDLASGVSRPEISVVRRESPA